MTNTTVENERFAREAGLKAQDMPPANHPLYQNDADIRNLGDLIDARIEPLTDDIDEGDPDDGSTGVSAFRAADDEDAYRTRADFVDSMGVNDPDEEADTETNTIPGAGIDRSPDITGTVRGLAPGMSTHLPLDLGADGFQIIEPEEVGDLRADVVDLTDYNLAESLEEMANTDPLNEALADDEEFHNGYVIPVTPRNNIAATNDSLDATRQLE